MKLFSIEAVSHSYIICSTGQPVNAGPETVLSGLVQICNLVHIPVQHKSSLSCSVQQDLTYA